MAEPLYRSAHDPDAASEATPAGGVPGKMPVTARLSGRSQIIFRVESAEAARELAGAFGPRDSNGVAAGSDVAVDRAASSSGHSLPEDVRGRFESSLGTDLSGVRVHTGDASAQAADAVGARAYTTGNDIHFGAGQYDPSSAFGVHLLAHEVAHTVQQQGAAPTRQNKLEVSAPQDAAETEADRAADAMVSGAKAVVSPAASIPMRSPPKPELPPIPGSQVPLPDDPASHLPKPVNWAGTAGGAIAGMWSGSPIFTFAYLLKDDDSAATKLAKSARAAFTADWTSAQTNWNKVVPQVESYGTAAADAEKKGLVDLQPGGGDLDAQVENGLLPGGDSSIGKAFNDDGSVGGKSNYEPGKIEKPQRILIDKAKKKVADATGDLGTAAGKCTIKRNEWITAGKAVNNARLDLEGVKEEAKKQGLEGELAALDTACKRIGEMAGAVAGVAGESAGSAGQAGAAIGGVLGYVNTSYWDSKTKSVVSEIQLINGKLAAISKIKAMTALETAVLSLKNAEILIQEAHNDYNKAARARAVAYQELSVLMEGAANASKATPGEAAAVGLAVQAVPALEYVLEITGQLLKSIQVPTYTEESGRGCGLALPETQATMKSKVGALTSNQKHLADAEQKWSKRLASVQKLLAAAH